MDYTAFAIENARAEFALQSRDSRDLEEAHRALRQIIAFLDGINGGADRQDIYYAIGQATGAAKYGLAASGGRRTP